MTLYYGGGIVNASSNSIVSNCVFTSNSAPWGGGVYNGSFAPTISNCSFKSNRSNYGGGIYNEGGYPTISNCAFTLNSAEVSGGGIGNDQSFMTISNCSFTSNSAEVTGGGIDNDTSNPTLENCTFASNSAHVSGGGISNRDNSSPTVKNSIIYGNNGGNISDDANSTAEVTYSCIPDGFIGLTGNITADPLFASGPNGDLYLLPTSECVDSGTGDAIAIGLGWVPGQGYGTNSDEVHGDAYRVDMGYHYSGYAQPTLNSPVPVTGLIGTAESTSSILWSWNDLVDEDGYKLHYLAYSKVIPVAANITTTLETGLTANTLCTREVNAYNTIGSSESNSCSVYTLALPPINPVVSGAYDLTYGYHCNISWETGGAQSGYRVYRDGIEGVGSLVYDGTGTSTVDGGLIPDTTYTYYIYAYNGDNVLTPASISSLGLTPPASPEGLFTSNITTNDAYGTWESDAHSFTISYGTDQAAANLGTITTTETSYTWTDLIPATTYYWQVSAGNSSGYGEYSEIVSFETHPLTPSVLTGTAESTSSIIWSWNDVTDADGYYLQDTSDNVVGSATAGDLGTTEVGLLANTQYTRHVVAYNGGGNMVPSLDFSVFTLADTPESLAVVKVTGATIRLFWSGDGTRYAVERASQAAGPWTYIATWEDNVTTTEYTDTGLPLSTTYWYIVRAYNGDQITTDASGVVSAETLSTLGVWYVSDSASGFQDGSQPHPFKTINSAEISAESGDEIRVQQGTYRLAASIILKPGVYLHGGYDGGWSPTVDRTTTIISGEGAVRCMSGSTLTSATTIENFTITNGYASGGSGYGGGMYLLNNSNPLINNCVFSSNRANISGGGIYGDHSSMTVSNCAFSLNIAVNNYGGGICNYISSSPVIKYCTFESNSANNNYGGGICNVQTSATINNCVFTSNSAKQGGGILNYFSADPVVTNCKFTGNTTPNFGGGMFNFTSSPEVKNCTFTANTASTGGGIFNYNSSSPVITNTIVYGNSPLNIASTSSTPTVTYSCVQRDTVYPGTGNISSEPLFVNGPAGDVHLLITSECIDRGSGDAHMLGLSSKEGYGTNPDGIHGDSNTVDMGYHYTGYTAAAINPLLITTASPLPDGMQGSAYSLQFAATGGETPYTWSLKGGSPPQLITLETNGLLHGTPATFETRTFTVEVTDSQAAVYDKQFSLTITPPGAKIPLVASWNLISLPVIPQDTSINSVIGNQLAGQTATVYSYSPAGGWDVETYNGTTWTGSVPSIEADKGYWILLGNAVTLEVTGNLSQTDRYITLEGQSINPGFNLVGTAFNSTQTMAQTHLGDYVTSSDVVWGYNNGWNVETYNGATWTGSVPSFEAGKGYWVIKNSSGNVTWDYPKP